MSKKDKNPTDAVEVTPPRRKPPPRKPWPSDAVLETEGGRKAWEFVQDLNRAIKDEDDA